MNKVMLMGRLTRDPEIRMSQGDMKIARYSLAVDRRGSRSNSDGQTADFINCVAFGRSADFAEGYLHKGTKLLVTGRIQTGSYTNKDGQRVYTTDVIVEDQEFAESKNADQSGSFSAPAGNDFGSRPEPQLAGEAPSADFINIPGGIEEELPFN